MNLIGGGMAFFEAAADAGAATGSNKSPAGAAGEDAFGSILNEGGLILDRVRIDGTITRAQGGGDGGPGLAGRSSVPEAANGTDGALFVVATAGGDGFDGGDGSRGRRGGDGGDAATILNRGTLR